jgi:CDP-diacylglycerol---serine O-phosphatidyltransferase
LETGYYPGQRLWQKLKKAEKTLRRDKFKKLIDNNAWLKYVPNSLTLCNSLCGFAAILYALNAFRPGWDPAEVFTVSAWIILFAMVFDALDGLAARIFNAASMHGVQMDSLADMVTFGVAPAFLSVVMAQRLLNMSLGQTIISLALCSIYLGCAALRLATYNVHAILEKKSGEKFTGLPTPGGASAICSMIMFYSLNFKGIEGVKHLAMLLPVYAAVLGLLMVSNIPYVHVGKWLQSVRRNRFRMVMLIIILLIGIIFGTRGIVLIINFYIFSGPALAVLEKMKLLPRRFVTQS